MTRARNEAEQLRYRIDEVDNLWNKEQKNRLAEVTQDANHGERHPGQVVKCIADENLRWIAMKKKDKVCYNEAHGLKFYGKLVNQLCVTHTIKILFIF